MSRKPVSQVTEAFPQRKRIAHQPRDQVKGIASTSKEKSNNASSVNQIELDVLKQFDLNFEYGPCTGITRMERWQRAEKFELSPPTEVRDIINRHLDDETYTHSLWNGYSTLS